MNILHKELLLPIILVTSVLFLAFINNRKKIETYIFKTWFKRTTFSYKLRKILYVLGITLILVSLLDFRGPEEKVESSIPDQKTIIIIDSSASMLAEDVRPNRFKKSLLMARHFVKKAYGHKVSVVLFSDTQKRLVPFTDDLDLLDARIAGLETVDLYDGGSNISQAIKESLGYFRNSSKEKEELAGNILVFTDSEGHDEDFTFNLPPTVVLGIVGVGTLKGARIPNRDKYGVFRGYKQYNRNEIVSKLNEDWLKSLSSKVKNYQYWVANSYTIPTEEIVDFFNKNFKKRLNKGLATIKPVKTQYVLIPGIILLSLSFLLYPLQSFRFLLILLMIGTLHNVESTMAQQQVPIEEESKPDPVLDELMRRHRLGELSNDEKMRMAEKLYEKKEFEAVNTLYKESWDKLSVKDKNNYAISLLQAKESAKALKLLGEVQKDIRNNESIDDEFKSSVRQNMLLALKEDQQQKQQQKKDKEKQQEQEKKDQDKKEQGDGGGDGDNQNQKPKDQKPEDSESKDKKNKNKEKKDDQKDGDEKKEQKQKSLEQKQKDIENKRKMVKIPGLIKQLMSDDRSLQQKYIDTSTDKPKSFSKKDW